MIFFFFLGSHCLVAFFFFANMIFGKPRPRFDFGFGI